MFRRRPLFLLCMVASVGTALASCSTSSTSEKGGPSSTAALARDCASAALTLPPESVVGTFDGAPITAKDLGPEAAKAEQRALHEYCTAVYAARSDALDALVTQRVIQREATAVGTSEESWLRSEVERRVLKPTDEQVRAFYEERKRPGAPPLEEVKDQVVQAMEGEQQERIVRSLLEELKKKASVTRALPDVRPPPRDVKAAAHTATKGSAAARVRVVEFADFQCPYCSMAASSVRELHAKYGDKVEFAYRHLPLRSIHPDAQRAAEYAQCSREQGKFWELHDKLYENQSALGEEDLKRSSAQVGLDAAKLEACMASGRAATEVNADVSQAEELGIQGTPTFFINGRQHTGPATPDALAAVIDAELAR